MDNEGFTDWCLGYTLVLKTIQGETVEGTIFAFDKTTQCVVITRPSSQPGCSDVKMLKLPWIKEVLSSKGPEKPFNATLPAIDHKRVEARELKALQKAKDLVASIGVGVTEEGQAIFDMLHKTMPARWIGKTIEVMDEVIVCQPYGSADCKLAHVDGNNAILERVCHILDAEAAIRTSGSA